MKLFFVTVRRLRLQGVHEGCWKQVQAHEDANILNHVLQFPSRRYGLGVYHIKH